MKYLFVNKAGAFSQDYKTHGFTESDLGWGKCSRTIHSVLSDETPSYCNQIKAALDLGSRRRSGCAWIVKDPISGSCLMVTALMGIASANRRDFTGRMIFDSVVFMASVSDGPGSEEQLLLEQKAVARGFVDAVSRPTVNFDETANIDDFEKDMFSFSDIDHLVKGLPARHGPAKTGYSNDGAAGSLDYIKEALQRFNISFELRLLGEKRRALDGSKNVGHRNNSPSASGPSGCGVDEIIQQVANAADVVGARLKEAVSEVITEDRAGRLFRPFRDLRTALDGLRNASPFRKRPSESSRTQDGPSPGEFKPDTADARSAIIDCPLRPESDVLDSLTAAIFGIPAGAINGSVCMTVGGLLAPELIASSSDKPAPCVFISIK